MAPLVVNVSDCTWDCMQVVVSTLFGVVIGSAGKVGAIGTAKLRMFGGPCFAQVAKTIGDRCSELGLCADGDALGVESHLPIEFASGLEATSTSHPHQKRLSIDSSVGVLIIQNVRMYGLRM